MTTFYKCESCDYVDYDIDPIDLNEWASRQDRADVYGLPAGTCTECGAPVYEEGTFNKLAAARAMLAALDTFMQLPMDDDGRTYAVAVPFADMAAMHAALTAAERAGITPAPLTK